MAHRFFADLGRKNRPRFFQKPRRRALSPSSRATALANAREHAPGASPRRPWRKTQVRSRPRAIPSRDARGLVALDRARWTNHNATPAALGRHVVGDPDAARRPRDRARSTRPIAPRASPRPRSLPRVASPNAVPAPRRPRADAIDRRAFSRPSSILSLAAAAAAATAAATNGVVPEPPPDASTAAGAVPPPPPSESSTSSSSSSAAPRGPRAAGRSATRSEGEEGGGGRSNVFR